MTAFRNQWLKVKQPPQTSTRTTVAAGLIQVTAHRSQMQPALLTHSPSLPHTHKYFSLSVPTLHKDKHNINRKTTHRLTTWAPPSCACWLWTNDISFNIKLSNKNEAFYFRLQGLYTRGTTEQCQSDASRETITKESFRMTGAEPSGVDEVIIILIHKQQWNFNMGK